MEIVKACRVCLIMDVKMYDLQSYPLSTYVEPLLRNELLSIVNSPPLACYECAHLIQKFYFFRQKLYRSQAVLYGLRDKSGQVLHAELKQVDRKGLSLLSNISECTIHVDSVNNELDVVVKDEWESDDNRSVVSDTEGDIKEDASYLERIMSSDDEEPLSEQKKKIELLIPCGIENLKEEDAENVELARTLNKNVELETRPPGVVKKKDKHKTKLIHSAETADSTVDLEDNITVLNLTGNHEELNDTGSSGSPPPVVKKPKQPRKREALKKKVKQKTKSIHGAEMTDSSADLGDNIAVLQFTNMAYKKRKLYEMEDMEAALNAVRQKQMGYLKASKTFNVPRTTLFRLAFEKDKTIEALLPKKIGRKPVFDERFENELTDYGLKMETLLYGLTQTDMRRLAYQLAKRNNLPNPFKNEMAGRYWFKGFLNRNKDRLSMRKPTGTSFARARGFNKESMDDFYNILEKTYAEINFTADRIYNVDETGLSIVQSKIPKVIGRRGKTQIGAMSSAERGSLITIVTCMSPAGIFVPPMIIFPRKNMTETLMRGAPLGSIGRAHPSGWIQTYLFTQWFEHFVKFVRPSEASPVLLLLDGHYSHTKNIDLVDMARREHVTIVSLPPHCTHKIQPMRSFMTPVKTYYSEEIRMWLREKNRPLTQYDIVELFGKAYLNCQKGSIAAKGFSVGGIYPLNRHVFSETDYLAAGNEENAEPFQARPTIHPVLSNDD